MSSNELDPLFAHIKELWDYKAIGTVEEFKKLKEAFEKAETKEEKTND